MIVAGVDISRKYSIEEVQAMYESGRYRGIVLEGWIVRADADGMIGFVPWYESTLSRMEEGKTQTYASDGDFTEEMRQDVEREHPIVRRTPQQRKDAMASRLSKAQYVPDAIRTRVQEESFKRGTPLTGTDIEAAAAYLLNQAQNANREADSHRVTRAHPTA